jgi:predicted dinucleotide-utilizing enzyme
VLASLEGQYNSTETEQACDSSQQRQQQQQELAQQHACRQLQQIQPRQPLLEGAAQTAAVARGAAETLQGPSPKLAVQAGAETDRSQNHPWSNVSYGGGQHKGYF